MNWHAKTIDTYDASAHELAAYFAGAGARVDDIERALALADCGSSASVVEIGCGDGRDAAEIIPRVGQYVGVDPSAGLLHIARERLPSADFVQADALSYKYLQNVDACFAFASLLHVNKADLQTVLQKASRSLRAGGIYYISLKYRNTYTEEVKHDQYGQRMFYYYSPSLIKEFAAPWFESCYEDYQQLGATKWFTIALKKR